MAIELIIRKFVIVHFTTNMNDWINMAHNNCLRINKKYNLSYIKDSVLPQMMNKLNYQYLTVSKQIHDRPAHLQSTFLFQVSNTAWIQLSVPLECG